MKQNPLQLARIHFELAGGEMAKNKGLADPSRLDPLVPQDKQLLRVVIETPKGSRNKFAFNSDDHPFELKKVLPAGMAFPYDFGFVPCTKAADGDPIDVLVLMDELAFPGCILKCRLIGVIEGEQVAKDNKGKKKEMTASLRWKTVPTAGRISGLLTTWTTSLVGNSSHSS